MRTLTVTCDRCRQAIGANATVLDITTGPERLKRPTLDLCGPCLLAVLAEIDNGLAVTTSAETPT